MHLLIDLIKQSRQFVATMHVALAEDLNETLPQGRQLRQLIDAMASNEDFGGDDEGGYRRGRISAFFATLQWIIKRGPLEAETPDTHLLFYNSFRQIRILLNQKPATTAGFFSVRPRTQMGDSRFDAYELVFEG